MIARRPCSQKAAWPDRLIPGSPAGAATPSEGKAVVSPAWIPGISLSDHASFWLHGWRAIMISDTAPFRYPYYHSELDTPDKLDYARLARVVAGVARVVRDVAGGGQEGGGGASGGRERTRLESRHLLKSY